MLTIEKTPGTVLICGEGRPLLHYRMDGRDSKPYFDLVALPPTARRRAGENVILARPHDHVWHFGLFYAQKYVDEVNFWESELLAKKGEPHGRCLPNGEATVRGLDDGGVAFAHDVRWVTHAGEVWIAERREILVHPPAGDGYRIDWSLHLTAVGKDRVIRSACQYGDYSGLSYRSPRGMDRGAVLDSEGRADPKAIMGRPARWVDYSGKLDDCADMDDPDWAGITMFDHPSNPGHPVRWFCMNDAFGFLAANRTYGTKVTLPAGRAWSVRYGTLIHAGRGDASRLEREYQRFAAT